MKNQASNVAVKNRMPTRRRTRNDKGEANRGRRGQEKRGKGIVEEEMAEEILTIQDDTEEEIEMFDSDQDRGEQA